MDRSLRIALLAVLCAFALPAAAVRADSAGGPSGQFQPTRGDRDGDGVPDASDCAPDDPTRPARPGADANCDGVADGSEQAASRPSTSVATPAVSALRAAGESVVAVTGLRLGSAVAVFAPRHARAARPTVVLAARDNCGVTVRPTLIFTGGRRRALPAHVHSLARGDAYVVRLRLSASERRAARVRFAIAVTDATGTVHRATRTVRVAKP